MEQVQVDESATASRERASARSGVLAGTGLVLAVAALPVAFALDRLGGFWFLAKYVVLAAALAALDPALKRWPAARGLFYAWMVVLVAAAAIMLVGAVRS
ncbi:hypothetical protein [Cellulomonas sp. SLBN-39]|uniref:hypothetical protein n=1 Tax=Cellulomonas sp. SLBN-39 TaxID=2768446 RepID=UPI00115196A9|nr:hypothetical protein [Cellulomonas sp. SLBN-39]TQL04309.1 hypothetical protein FBY24_3426 [Cellulomonas sp. SLBN-39]